MDRHLLPPQVLLRAEGVAALVLALILYAEVGRGWGLFAALFLVPDVSLLAYLLGKRLGAVAYNTVHTYTLPAALFAGGFVLERGLAMAVALIWAAHIGADRLLGFGLKYRDGFRPTHLQRVAPQPARDPSGEER